MLCGMNSTMNNADKVISKVIDLYAEMRGMTRAEVLAAYETSDAVRNSIFTMVFYGVAAK
jgi:F0F1-type ATP synthase delta subunit